MRIYAIWYRIAIFTTSIYLSNIHSNVGKFLPKYSEILSGMTEMQEWIVKWNWFKYVEKKWYVWILS